MVFLLAAVEVGTQLYWGLNVHGQVLLVSWLVLFVVLGVIGKSYFRLCFDDSLAREKGNCSRSNRKVSYYLFNNSNFRVVGPSRKFLCGFRGILYNILYLFPRDIVIGLFLLTPFAIYGERRLDQTEIRDKVKDGVAEFSMESDSFFSNFLEYMDYSYIEEASQAFHPKTGVLKKLVSVLKARDVVLDVDRWRDEILCRMEFVLYIEYKLFMFYSQVCRWKIFPWLVIRFYDPTYAYKRVVFRSIFGVDRMCIRMNTKGSLFEYFVESVFRFVESIAEAQIGKYEYRPWVPFIGTLFLFIFVSNWVGAVVPWKIIPLPEGELAAPTNDINVTVALSLLTSISYFYGGLKFKGLSFFVRYISPTPIFLPINVLEDFTKPLSLSFRLFGNILADEIVVAVLCSLLPLFLPLPVMFLGLFASSVQALVFSTLSAAYIGESIE